MAILDARPSDSSESGNGYSSQRFRGSRISPAKWCQLPIASKKSSGAYASGIQIHFPALSSFSVPSPHCGVGLPPPRRERTHALPSRIRIRLATSARARRLFQLAALSLLREFQLIRHSKAQPARRKDHRRPRSYPATPSAHRLHWPIGSIRTAHTLYSCVSVIGSKASLVRRFVITWSGK